MMRLLAYAGLVAVLMSCEWDDTEQRCTPARVQRSNFQSNDTLPSGTTSFVVQITLSKPLVLEAEHYFVMFDYGAEVERRGELAQTSSVSFEMHLEGLSDGRRYQFRPVGVRESGEYACLYSPTEFIFVASTSTTS